MIREREGDGALYPAIYRQTKSGAFWPVAFVSVIFLARITSVPHHSPSVVLLFAAILFAAFNVFGAITQKPEITLYMDKIQIKRGSKVQTINRDDIYRIDKVGFSKILIQCKHLRGSNVYIPTGIGGDAAWNDWMIKVKGGDKLLGRSK